jgi:hypothetical protein
MTLIPPKVKKKEIGPVNAQAIAIQEYSYDETRTFKLTTTTIVPKIN